MDFFNVKEKIVYKPMTESPGYALFSGHYSSWRCTLDNKQYGRGDNPLNLPDPSYRLYLSGLVPNRWYYIIIDVRNAHHGYGNGGSESVQGAVGATIFRSDWDSTFHVLVLKPSQPNITIWSIDNPMTGCLCLQDIHPTTAG